MKEFGSSWRIMFAEGALVIDQLISETYLKFADDLEISERYLKFPHEGYRRLLYHLHLKYKRTYLLTVETFNNTMLDFSEIELLPLVRTLIETQLHLKYVIKFNEEPDRIFEEYTTSAELSNFSLGRQLSRMKNKPESVRKIIKKHFKGKKKPEPPKHLKYMNELAKMVNRETIYYNYYLVFNSFTHFNPSTYVNYVTVKDGVNYFNSPDHDIKEHQEQISQCVDVLALDIMADYMTIIQDERLEKEYVTIIEHYTKKYNQEMPEKIKKFK